jgi:hypothetical protein
MEILSSLMIIGLAALIHGGFQLSVSVLTLLSGHAIGAKRSRAKLFRLTTGFVVGALTATMLLLSFMALVFTAWLEGDIPTTIWVVAVGLLIATGLAVWGFYFRGKKGTTLWIPRSAAKHLSERAKQTKRSFESFSLGMATIFAEILFIFAILVVGALTLTQLEPMWQLVGILLYGLLSTLALGIVWAAVGSGKSISKIQRWREANKKFIQFISGTALFILAVYVFVEKIMANYAGVM